MTTQQVHPIVEEHTRVFNDVETPVRPRDKGKCYATCWKLAYKHPTWMYVEGTATAPTGITHDHAWLLRDGRVYDPTWGNSGTNYRGVVFNPEYVQRLTKTQWDASSGVLWMVTSRKFQHELPEALLPVGVSCCR